MSKWIEEFNKSNQIRINKRIIKLKEEIQEYKRNYRDFPYDRYLKAIERREAEIDELERFGNPLNAKQEVDDYKEELGRMKKVLGNIHYLSLNIDPCDQKSDGNVRKLQGITSQYDCYDYDFKNHADQGVW